MYNRLILGGGVYIFLFDPSKKMANKILETNMTKRGEKGKRYIFFH